MEALKKREEKMWEKSRQKRVNGWRNWVNSDADKGPKRPKIKEVRRAPRGLARPVPAFRNRP